MDLPAPAPAHGVGGGGGHGADEEDDHPVDESLMEPAVFLVDDDDEEEEEGEEEADEMLANPNQQHQMAVHGVYNVDQVNNFIETNEWNLLEQHIVNAMPRSQDNAHPSLVHPTPFITIWRRQLMDLIGGGRYDESAQIFVEKVVPLKTIVTAYADADKLSEEITKIERSVGSRTSFAHAHCGTQLMMKLINDYMRLYLPNVIGHRRPKGKHSALWDFALSLDVPVPGVKRHPHVRCLACSVKEYSQCRIGVDMTEHLEVCPGMTPEAERRYSDALKKGRGKKKRHRTNAIDVNVSKAPKLTANPQIDPLHMIYQKLPDGKQVLDTMRSNQGDVNIGINSLEEILQNIGGLVALAMQGQGVAAQPVVAAPSPREQAPIPAQAIIAAAVPRQAPPPAAATPPAPAPAIVPPPPPAPALQGDVLDYYSTFDDSEFLPELPEL